MDDLLADFIAETRDMLDAISGEIVAWEANPSDNGHVDAIFRFMHTVKGNCGFFDFPELARLSHAAEDTLDYIRGSNGGAGADVVNAVLAAVDLIGVMVGAIEKGEPLADLVKPDLLAALSGHSPSAIGGTNAPQETPVPCDASHPISQITESIDDEPAVGAQSVPERGEETPNVPAAMRSVRLPVPLLDRVMSGVSDLVLARNDLSRMMFNASVDPVLDAPFERLSAILRDVRDAVTKMRMQRIDTLYNSMPRMVRDLAQELDKKVAAKFEGGDVELDREVIEMMRDPIMHIVRNAIDHGLEQADERIAAGKSVTGTVTVTARQAGNRIALVIKDDGQGLNIKRIGQKALAAGLVSEDQLARMSAADILEFIFMPGFSTADQVSAISGRGVGMDVVRANIEKVGGTINVRTKRGQGTQFELYIPLMLSIVSALLVGVGAMRFAIALSAVDEILVGKSSEVAFSNLGDCLIFSYRGQQVPCVSLGAILGISDAPVTRDQKFLLIKGTAGGGSFALAVDRVFNNEDLVIKPISPAIMNASIYSGTSLLDDGRPVLMLDMQSVAQKANIGAADDRCAALTREVALSTPAETPSKLLVFTDFGGRQRAVRMELIARIDEIDPAHVQRDLGSIWVLVAKSLKPVIGLDAQTALPERIKMLRLFNGEREAFYAIEELHEITNFTGFLADVATDPAIEGFVLHEGSALPVVDGHHIFAQCEAAAPTRQAIGGTRPVCRIPLGDPWAQHMLRPLVEAAGYEIAQREEDHADIVILLDHDTDAANGDASAYLTLYSDPEMASTRADGIFRYDRKSVVSALKDLRTKVAV